MTSKPLTQVEILLDDGDVGDTGDSEIEAKRRPAPTMPLISEDRIDTRSCLASIRASASPT
jgi:hypothetical protein